jgi:hypothetical protein
MAMVPTAIMDRFERSRQAPRIGAESWQRGRHLDETLRPDARIRT